VKTARLEHDAVLSHRTSTFRRAAKYRRHAEPER
jgi:hypothetical protein